MAQPNDAFQTLFVCHANLCRSPMAERLAGVRAARAEGLAVASAGTHAQPGRRMHPYTEQVLAELGAAPDGFRSQPATAPLLAGSQLVLTATRRQRAHCVSLAPATVRRTFTLRQFARLAATVDRDRLAGLPAAARARALVDEVAAARGTAQPVPPDDDDLLDPVGQPVESFRTCSRTVTAALDVVFGLIVPT
ncbi:low molecular weight phosphatase family protein [Phytohabitans sp. ZYX-F-186]|uniref:Low molecular weight phosphatase family protein n=1 Tax=Phytohabitans maris TaxID=3071409 RepID=A0ABU0ZMP8_9ACTN|nr:low molecular weight phosphatase family protein [Phytohabitans sp. ZYX-F-186]MDQ7908228.1 low molecular weight phosphatase family protein [Phytohabitans sp. ZYX-F-186]